MDGWMDQWMEGGRERGRDEWIVEWMHRYMVGQINENSEILGVRVEFTQCSLL